MSIPANSILQLAFLGAYANDRILHIRNFVLAVGGTGAETPAEVQAAFLNVVKPTGTDDLATPYLACLTSGYTLQQMRAQIVYPTRYRATILTAGLNIPGTRGATSTALLDCVLTMQTDLSGRSQVGNYKIGPAPATDFTNGTLGVDITDALNNYRETFEGTIETVGGGLTGWKSCIYHPNFQPGGESFNLITSGYVQDTARAKTTRTARRGI